MRQLLFFMLLVGVFVIGKNACQNSGSNWQFGIGGESGKGELVTREKNLDPFTQIHHSISADIEWRQGENCTIEINAQENIANLITTDVKNGELHIGFSKSVSSHKPIKLQITSPNLSGVHIAGSGSFTAFSPLDAPQLNLQVSGSGSVKIPEIKASVIQCHIAGSGDLDLAGTATNMDAHISGSGKVAARNLTLDRLKAHIAGSGDMYCKVNTHIDAHIAGSGALHYSGNPSIQSHVAGSGDVVKE